MLIAGALADSVRNPLILENGGPKEGGESHVWLALVADGESLRLNVPCNRAYIVGKLTSKEFYRPYTLELESSPGNS